MFIQLIHQTRIIFLVTFFFLATTSCKEDNVDTPPATPGSVNGSFTPSNAATSVSLDTITGAEKYTIAPNPDGTFYFPSVLPGQYKLRITPTPIYYTPTQSNVSVSSGINTTVPAVNLTYNTAAQTGNIDFTLDGTDYTILNDGLFLSYASSVFNLNGGTSTTPSYYYLDINLNSVSGVGTFNIASSASFISIFYYTSPGNIAGNWSTNGGGTGTVTITTLNTTTRTASGTFTGSLAPQGASIGTKSISGTFTNVLY